MDRRSRETEVAPIEFAARQLGPLRLFLCHAVWDDLSREISGGLEHQFAARQRQNQVLPRSTRSPLGRRRPLVGSGRHGSAPPPSIKKRHVRTSFVRRRTKQRRVRSGEPLAERQRGSEGDAVGKRQWAARPVVVASVETAREQTDGLVRGHDLHASQRQPTDLLLHIFSRPALEANEDVEHFAEVDRADAGRLAGVTQQNLDFAGGRLARQRRHDRLGIENTQRRALSSSPADSSPRTIARALSVSGPRPRSDPIAAPTGSSGIGRMTMALP